MLSTLNPLLCGHRKGFFFIRDKYLYANTNAVSDYQQVVDEQQQQQAVH